MNPIKAFLFILSFTITLLFFSCEKTTEPENTSSNRDYTWTIDTINPGPAYRTYGMNLWGAAPDDIWMVGGAASILHPIWHYNGEVWRNVVLDEFISGLGICGFASDNIWMGTSNNSIWHFDGTAWKKFCEIKYKDYDRVFISSMHGARPDEIYGVGFATMHGDDDSITRVAIKYDGTNWNFLNLSKYKEHFERVRVNKVNNSVFIISNRRNSPDDYYHLYLVENDSLKEITSSDEFITFGNIDGEIFPIVGNTIYNYQNDKLVPMIDLHGTNFKNRAWGRNKSDFFTVNYDAELGHYNGSDLINIQNFPNILINTAMVFDKDIFIHGMEYNNFMDVIIHGKLK